MVKTEGIDTVTAQEKVKTGKQPRSILAHEDGSMTIDNASVQRLMDYGLLHYTNKGWIIGRWDDAVKADAPR